MASSARVSRAILISAGILAASSILLCVFAHFYSRFPGDLETARWLQGFNNGVMLSAMRGISWLFGGWRPTVIVIASAAFVLVSLGRMRAALIALAGVCASSSSILKLIVGRPRPPADLVRVLDVETNGSFPSGHVLFTATVLGFLIYLCLSIIRNKAIRIASVVVLSVLILLTSVSRVYLGAHWPSDTLGGYVIAGFFVSVLTYLDRSMSHRGAGIN